LRWEDERYVRLYTSDTVNWTMLPWQAQAILPLLMRKVDLAGILDIGNAVTPAAAVHAILGGVPFDVVEPGVDALLAAGTCQHLPNHGMLLLPNYMDAQQARHSDKARKRSQRERVVAVARLHDLADAGVEFHPDETAEPEPAEEPVTHRDIESQSVTKEAEPDAESEEPTKRTNGAAAPRNVTHRDQKSRTVTNGHTRSHAVTLSVAERSEAKLSDRSSRDPLGRIHDHPDVHLVDKTGCQTASEYRPSAYVVELAGKAGMTENQLANTLALYRSKGRIQDGSQRNHDAAFGGFLKRAREQARAAPGGRSGPSGTPGAVGPTKTATAAPSGAKPGSDTARALERRPPWMK